MWVSTDRWSCPHPSCQNRTTVIDGSPEDTAAAIEALRDRHYREHREAAQLGARIDQERLGKVS